jgi:hypothetical protein
VVGATDDYKAPRGERGNREPRLGVKCFLTALRL